MLPLYTAIKGIADQQGKTMYRIEHDLQIGNGIIRRWDRVSPRFDLLQAVSDYLGTTPGKIINVAKQKQFEMVVSQPSTLTTLKFRTIYMKKCNRTFKAIYPLQKRKLLKRL